MRLFQLGALVSIHIGVISGALCYMPLDIVLVQDTTGTFQDVLPNIAAQLTEVTANILTENPNSRFGLAQFRDKPYYPFGIDSDFCYKLNSDLLSDAAAFQTLYASLETTSGGDLPDAQYHALVNVAQDDSINWRTLQRPASEETAGAHVVILVTDSAPHLEGDVPRYHALYPDTLPDLPSYPDNVEYLDYNSACLDYDYPSPTKVYNIIKQENVAVVFITPNIPDVTASWRWVNDNLLLQPADYYQTVNADFSDFKDKLLAALTVVTTESCGDSLPSTSTTTVQPSLASSDDLVTDSTVDGNCTVPCPPSGPCCRRPGVLIEVNNNPKKLTVDYEKL